MTAPSGGDVQGCKAQTQRQRCVRYRARAIERQS
jgi:hypothetical protein